jgi:serine/threonine-protein kinase
LELEMAVGDNDAAPSTPRNAASGPISIGRVLGDTFELVGVLGEGGTGIVYDAWLLEPGDVPPEERRLERVALKVIHGHLLGDTQIRGRFAREAKILRRLQGPHLCAIVDAGEIPDPHGTGTSLLYIALPKIEGVPLDQLLRQEGPLPIDRCLDIALEVCAALRSAHAQGVIHRDLKPANVILEDGKRAVDFGMAKIVTGAGVDSTALTSHNMVFGTPEYMSPEQARGDELDARCDVYAVGVLLYELLTGTVPFKGKSPLHVLTAHLTQEPVAPRVRAPEREISPALEAVVLHALVKDPHARYPTASSVAAAIVRARAQPEDTVGVAPSASVEDTDLAHSPTMPAPLPSDPPPSSNSAVRSRPTPRLTTPVVPAPNGSKSNRGTTIVLWLVAVAIGIAIGVALSLKS